MDFKNIMYELSKIKTKSETKMCRNGKCVCTKNGKRISCRKNKKLNKTFKKINFFESLPFFNKSKKRRRKH